MDAACSNARILYAAGFALVEAGFTRVKNTANILMKNFVDFMFGSLYYTGLSVSIDVRRRRIHRNASLL